MEMFAATVTEQGTVSYHSPGDELDSLPKALLFALFANMTQLQQGLSEMRIKKGSAFQEIKDNRLFQEEKMLALARLADS